MQTASAGWGDSIEVVFEDADVLALNKPAGLVVHPDGKTDEYALVDWLSEHYPDIKDVGEPLTLTSGQIVERPGIVHRLDRETSGIMLIAKTQDAHAHLKRQFQDREVEKEYRAFVHGAFKDMTGIIDKPIGRSPKDFRRWSAQPGARGTLREAVTEYAVLEQNTDAAYLSVLPKTGRTHQIRVHLKAIHHPVICDSLYAPKQQCILGFERLALHAFCIAVELPGGERHTFEAPLPQDFERAIDLLKENG